MCDPLLSSLCTIWRHKQWAQCNGVRDPTVYVKQKDLATPKGIDHDYNYLTSIERELDHAEKEATSRGIILEEASVGKKNKKKGEVPLEAAIEKCGVIMMKAPKGMSRSKQNETTLTKKKRKLKWTVEWIDPDGRKTFGSCLEDEAIADAYASHLETLDNYQANKKRRGNFDGTEDSQSDVTTLDKGVQKREEPTSAIKQERLVEQVKRKRREGKGEDGRATSEKGYSIPRKKQEEPQQLEEKPSFENGVPSMGDIGRERSPSETSADYGDERGLRPPVSTCTTAQPTSTLSLTFYLHHPSLPSKDPILIPLPPDAILATSLTNRLVLEFPTIYIFPKQQDGRLPEGFVKEDDFFATAKKDLIADAIEVETSIVDIDFIADDARSRLEDGEVDEGHLLEVLGKDLTGITASL